MADREDKDRPMSVEQADDMQKGLDKTKPLDL